MRRLPRLISLPRLPNARLAARRVGAAAATPAFSAAKQAIADDGGDVTLVFVGDSTSDGTDEFVYLFADWLGGEYPTHTVKHHLWSDAATDYAAATTLSTGSGANTINVYNASLSGALHLTWQGDRFATALAALSPDAVVFHLGHNEVSYNGSTHFRHAMVQQLQSEIGPVPVAYHLQNPRRDDDQMADEIAEIRSMAAKLPKITLIDSHSHWIAAGKPSAWYTDNVHPNSTGSAEILGVFQDAWNAASGPSQSFATWWDADFRANENELLNGDFAAFSGATPDNWTTHGTGTISKDTTVFYPGKTYSVKLEQTSANFEFRQTLNAAQRDAIKGQTITFAMRWRTRTGNPLTAGRRLLQPSSGAIANPYEDGNIGVDGWKWSVSGGHAIPADITSFLVRLFTAADSTASTINIDEALLYVGDFKPEAL